MPQTSTEAPFSAASVEVIPGGPVEGSIRPPGSKSLTNRALICAAFAHGSSTLRGALRSEDTEVMIKALASIGIDVRVSDGGRVLNVNGAATSRDQHSDATTDLFIANSGTSVRFLAAALSATGGNYRLHGVDRMHQRPIGDLVSAVAPVMEGTIRAVNPGGCPPVELHSQGWSKHRLEVAGSVSSQYLSGLMMAAPIATQYPVGQRTEGIQISVVGKLVSRPYIDMTAEVMRSFGARVRLVETGLSANESLLVEIEGDGYHGTQYEIEPDASAASYFWAAAAITGGKVTVEGLHRNAMQGDVGFCNALEQMGCKVDYDEQAITITGKPLRGVDLEMNQISDTVQTLAVVALFADGPTRVRGVAHNRFKETDRIGDLACELRKLGARTEEHEDGLTIHPPSPSDQHAAILETYHDHRMAMSLSLAGLRMPGVQILNPSCTAKTYPQYFADLERLLGRAHHWRST